MNERFQQVLRIWKEDENSYEQNRWKQQLRTLSKPAKEEVGASWLERIQGSFGLKVNRLWQRVGVRTGN